MFKGFNNRQQNGFVNLNFNQDYSAYGQSGCSFWLRADYGLNTNVDLQNISSWTDFVSGDIFTQTTLANQPTFLASDSLYNNLPVVNFSSSAMSLLNTKLSNIGRTIAFIANYSIINNRNVLLTGDGTINNIIALGGTVTGFNGVSLVSNSVLTSGTTENTNVKICVISDNFIMVNGVVESSANNLINFPVFRIGSFTQGSSLSSLTGKIAEIIGYSIPLTQAQALALSNNINQKYVIY
jgi:hypothetical protein